MAMAYQTHLATFSPVWEYKMQDASGPPADSGSHGLTLSSETEAFFTYQSGPTSNIFYDDLLENHYYIAQTAAGDSGWYSTDLTWFTGSTTTGSFVFIFDGESGGDTYYCINHGLSTATYTLRVYFSGTGTVRFQLYGAGGAGTDEITITSGDYDVPVAGYPTVVVITQDGNGVQMYLNGLSARLDQNASVTETAGDEGMWLHTLNGNTDGMTIGGYAFWSGGAYSGTMLEEYQGSHFYAGYFSTAFTSAQALEIYHQVIGGAANNTQTVTGRNKRRRYWNAQSRSVTQTGIDAMQEMFAISGSSVNEYCYDIARAGGLFFNRTDGPFYSNNLFDSTLRTNINTTWYGQAFNSNGNLAMGNDGTGTYFGASMTGMKWNGRQWVFITADNPLTSAGAAPSGSPQWGVGWAYHPSADLVMATHSQRLSTYPNMPSVWRYNSGTDTWETKHYDYMDQLGGRGFVSTTYHTAAFSPDGLWAASGHNGTSPWNTSSTCSISIWALTTTTDPYDTWTFQTPGTAFACYGVFFGSSDHPDHMFTLRYSATSGTIHVVPLSLSGGTWSVDSNLWNNNVQLTNWDSVPAQGGYILAIGDDIYYGTDQGNTSRTSYKNFWHLRWNGSYYEQQTDPPYPHTSDSPQVGVAVTSIAATPDGAGLVVGTSNTGANDIPVLLGYNRDTTTGVLTLRDSPYDFWDYNDANPGRTRTDGNTDYYGQIIYNIPFISNTKRQAYS